AGSPSPTWTTPSPEVRPFSRIPSIQTITPPSAGGAAAGEYGTRPATTGPVPAVGAVTPERIAARTVRVPGGRASDAAGASVTTERAARGGASASAECAEESTGAETGWSIRLPGWSGGPLTGPAGLMREPEPGIGPAPPPLL